MKGVWDSPPHFEYLAQVYEKLYMIFVRGLFLEQTIIKTEKTTSNTIPELHKPQNLTSSEIANIWISYMNYSMRDKGMRRIPTEPVVPWELRVPR